MAENLGAVEIAELVELEMQELETLEAPGFWTGVSIGTAISASVATSITLTVSLLYFGLLDGPRAVVSAMAVVPALAGMWLGQQVRLRLSIEQFRLAVFWALLLTGVYTFASRVL